jgi:hypothetical protein
MVKRGKSGRAGQSVGAIFLLIEQCFECKVKIENADQLLFFKF